MCTVFMHLIGGTMTVFVALSWVYSFTMYDVVSARRGSTRFSAPCCLRIAVLHRVDTWLKMLTRLGVQPKDFVTTNVAHIINELKNASHYTQVCDVSTEKQ